MFVYDTEDVLCGLFCICGSRHISVPSPGLDPLEYSTVIVGSLYVLFPDWRTAIKGTSKCFQFSILPFKPHPMAVFNIQRGEEEPFTRLSVSKMGLELGLCSYRVIQLLLLSAVRWFSNRNRGKSVYSINCVVQ